MNILLPNQLSDLWVLIATIIFLLLVGYALLKVKQATISRWFSWALALMSVGGIHYYTLDDPAAYRMLAIINVLFVAMKMVVAITYFEGKKPFSFLHWLSFSIAWIGMHPSLFERPKSNRKKEAWQLIRFGGSRIILGGTFLIIAYQIAQYDGFPSFIFQQIISSLFALIGSSLILHFGVLNLNAGVWNLLGVPAYAVFRAPLTSLSLKEFWGKRWNIAFSEMAAIAVYKPLRPHLGTDKAKLVAFFFSGVLHELALSVPVGRGYGLPTLFFIIQALLIQAEAKLNFRTKLAAHFWVLMWLILPMGLLFHPYFLAEVIWPFLNKTW